MKFVILTFIQGILIGISLIIPGLSGGTTAILLGIYQKLLDILGDFSLKVKKEIKFLFILSIGCIAGIFIGSIPVKFAIANFKTQFGFFVTGVLIGSLSIFTNEFKIKKLANSVYIGMGITIIILITKISLKSSFFVDYIILPSLISTALILPGISVTNILIAFGQYDVLLNSIVNFDFVYIVKTLFLLSFSTFLLVKSLSLLYKKYPAPINMLTLGMVIVSIFQVWKEYITNFYITDIFWGLFGLFLSLFISLFHERTNDR